MNRKIQINISTDSKSATSTKCTKCGSEILFDPIISGFNIVPPEFCPKCANEEFNREAMKELEAKQRDHEIAWQSTCPPLYRTTDPRRIPQDKLKKVMAWEYNPKGLILHGFTGTYKTRTAYLLLRRLHDDGIKIAAFDSADFVNQCADKFYNGTGGAWIEKLIRIQMLFLDDLGNEASGERGAGEIFHVIKRRGEELLPVIITTNSVGGELSTKIKGSQDRGPALVRRFRELCEPIAF